MTFLFSLGGRSWDLPHLPWKICRTGEPAVMGYYEAFLQSGGLLTAIPAQRIDALADAAFAAISFVDPAMDRAAFDDLPFGVSELAASAEALARAVGLKPAKAEGASAGEPESASIGTS